MRRQTCCASAAAIFALTAHGQTAPPAAPAAAEATPSTAPAEPESGSHWWSFGEREFMEGLGMDPEAGVFRLGIWHTVLDLRANGNMQETNSEDYADEKFYSYLTDEGLTVRNDGWYVLDPRLLTGSASVRVGWQQSHQDAGDQGTSQEGDLTDYYVNMLLLSEKPYNATLKAAHSEFVTSHAGGGTTATNHTNQGGTLYWRESSILREKEIAPYFSATLLGENEDLNETTTNAGRQFRRDEQRERVQFDAHNGFETGDLTVSLEQVDLTNKVYSDGSYRSRTADISYGVDFGENLTRHSNTDFNYSERTGNYTSETLDLEEYLFVEHNAFLSSSLYYLLQDVDSVEGASTAQRVDAAVQYQPYLNFTTNFDGFGTHIEYDTGTVKTQGGYADVTYNHGLPASGVLTATLGSGLSFADSQLVSSAVPVVDAEYQAPPELGAGAAFMLNETDVVTSSIVVYDVRGGARLPAELGADYEVEVEGNRTRILPLATSAVILAGDPLEVSYSYLRDPSARSRTGTQSYLVSAEWDWIGVSLSHDITREDPLSGEESTLLNDQDRTALRVDLRHDWGDWRALGNARVARYRDERLNYDEVRLNENLTWRPSYDWQLTMDASQTQSKFLDSDRTNRHFDARLGGTWHSHQGWWADGYLNWRTERDSESVAETITEGFFRVRRNWPQLTLSCSVGLGLRDRGTVQTTYENLQLNITRTF